MVDEYHHHHHRSGQWSQYCSLPSPRNISLSFSRFQSANNSITIRGITRMMISSGHTSSVACYFIERISENKFISFVKKLYHRQHTNEWTGRKWRAELAGERLAELAPAARGAALPASALSAQRRCCMMTVACRSAPHSVSKQARYAVRRWLLAQNSWLFAGQPHFIFIID